MYKPYYNREVLVDLYKQAEEYWRCISQWNNPNSSPEYFYYSHKYHLKCDAVVQIIENAVCHSVCGGVPEYSGRRSNRLRDRLDSIKEYLK